MLQRHLCPFHRVCVPLLGAGEPARELFGPVGEVGRQPPAGARARSYGVDHGYRPLTKNVVRPYSEPSPRRTVDPSKKRKRKIRDQRKTNNRKWGRLIDRDRLAATLPTMPEIVLYHFTDPANLASIAKHGLIPHPLSGIPGHEAERAVWLNSKPENAADFYQSAMLTVRIDLSDPRLRPDPDDDSIAGWFIYRGAIPPDRIAGLD
jgi:hypothetical protein